MALITVKPTSAGRRSVVRVVDPGLHKGAPYAPLTESQSKTGGRNNYGRITTRHKGGGHKQHYRIIDFKRDKDGIPAASSASNTIRTALRTSPWCCYADGERRYIIAPKGVEGRRSVDGGSRRADQGRQLAAAAQYPGRFDGALHRDEAGQGCADCA